MASHLETTDVPLLYSPQYITVRGRVSTVDPHVQSIISSEYWDGPALSHGKKQCPRSETDSAANAWTKRHHPQMSSGRSRTSSLQKKDGWKMRLWSRTYVVISWSPTDSVNGTARL